RASGLDVSNFQTALSSGANSRQAAVESSQELRDKFALLGVTLEDLQNPGKKTLDLMKQIVASADDIHSETFRTAFRDIFGKGSEKLIVALSGLGSQTAPIISERSVNAVDRLAKGFDRVRQSIQTAFGELTGTLLDRFFQKLENGYPTLSKV